jgi:hypothetical protein
MKQIGLLVVVIMVLFLCGTAHATDWSREGEFLIDTNVVNLNSQHEPAVAFDGTNYLVVWEDDRNGDWNIYGARVDEAGNIIDPIAIPISTEPNDQRNPAICFCGADYLVVWEDTRNDSLGDIYGARINQAGVVLDPTGIAVSTAAHEQLHPSIAFDGTNYLVVWQDTRNDTLYQIMDRDIYGARVNQNGIVLDSSGIGIKVDPYTPPNWQRDSYPSLAFGGSQYLVVWTFSGGSMPDHTDILGLRVGPSGTVLDTMVISFPTLSPNPVLPVVAFDGTSYLAVWWAYFDEGTSIECARVDQGGNVLDTAVITINTAGNPFFPPYPSVSVAFDGIYYMIAWHDSGNVDFDIYGAKLNTSGIVIESFDVSIQPGSQISPSLAHGIGDQMLITYSGWTDSINGNPVNRMRIWGKFYPFVGIEEGETDFVKKYNLAATIFSGPLQLPEGKQCKVFDITGRTVAPDKIKPGIYFIEIDGQITQKVIKVR